MPHDKTDATQNKNLDAIVNLVHASENLLTRVMFFDDSWKHFMNVIKQAEAAAQEMATMLDRHCDNCAWGEMYYSWMGNHGKLRCELTREWRDGKWHCGDWESPVDPEASGKGAEHDEPK